MSGITRRGFIQGSAATTAGAVTWQQLFHARAEAAVGTEPGHSGGFNVRDFGAAGDGVTDDATAIQNAIDAAGLVNGTVYFPSGIYKTTSQLVVDTDGVGLGGAGAYATTLDCISSGPQIDAENCLVENLTLDGTSGGGVGLHLTAAQRSRFSNVIVQNFSSHGILIDAESRTVPNNNNNLVSWDKVRSNLNGGDGFHIAETGGTVNYNGHTFRQCEAHSNRGSGILMRGWAHVVIGGNYATNSRYGFEMSEAGDSTTISVDNLLIWPFVEGNMAGNVFSSTRDVGLLYMRRSGASAAADRPGKITEIFAGRRTADGEFNIVTGGGETLELRGNEIRMLANGSGETDLWIYADGSGGNIRLAEPAISQSTHQFNDEIRLGANTDMAATGVATLTGTIEVFNSAGVSLGYVPIYASKS
jgi:hypothetical protein